MNDQTIVTTDSDAVAPTAPSLDAATAKIMCLRKWEAQITEALHHGGDTHSFDDVCQMVMSNVLAMFDYGTAFLLMEVVKYPRFSVLHCFIAGGEMQAVLDSEKGMMELAKQLGCSKLSFAGREGWIRVHKNNGWTPICSTLYKEVV